MAAVGDVVVVVDPGADAPASTVVVVYSRQDLFLLSWFVQSSRLQFSKKNKNKAVNCGNFYFKRIYFLGYVWILNEAESFV